MLGKAGMFGRTVLFAVSALVGTIVATAAEAVVVDHVVTVRYGIAAPVDPVLVRRCQEEGQDFVYGNRACWLAFRPTAAGPVPLEVGETYVTYGRLRVPFDPSELADGDYMLPLDSLCIEVALTRWSYADPNAPGPCRAAEYDDPKILDAGAGFFVQPWNSFSPTPGFVIRSGQIRTFAGNFFSHMDLPNVIFQSYPPPEDPLTDACEFQVQDGGGLEQPRGVCSIRRVAEPVSPALLGLGVVGLGLARRRKSRLPSIADTGRGVRKSLS